jgi:hypothetical protein
VAEFDALEAEMDTELALEVVPAVPFCNQALDPNAGRCAKPADVSRGAGFAPSNEQACTAANSALGCEFSKEKNLYFPKCAAGFHVVTSTPSLCSLNCPMGWSDEPTQCVKTSDQSRFDPSSVQQGGDGAQCKRC